MEMFQRNPGADSSVGTRFASLRSGVIVHRNLRPFRDTATLYEMRTCADTLKLTRALLPVLFVLQASPAFAQGSITGTVYDSLSTHALLANTTVVLVEKSRYATTDAKGHFRMDSIPDGIYTISFLHPYLDSLGLPAPAAQVIVAAGKAVALSLSSQSPITLYSSLCPGPRDEDSGVIFGRVRDVDDQSPLANATISTEWSEYQLVGGRSTAHPVRAAARSNTHGLYVLCGVPTETNLDLRSDVAGFIAGPTPLVLDTRLISRIDFAVSRKDSATRDILPSDSTKVAATKPGTAILKGAVHNGDGRPLGNANVSVLGTRRSAVADSAGVFRIDGIPAGTRTVEVKSLGLMATTFTVDFATGSTHDTTLSMSRAAQNLKTVAVKGKGNSTSLMELNGFEGRRAQGLGAFVTRAQLDRFNTSSLAGVFSGIKEIHMEYGHRDERGRTMPPTTVAYLRGTGGTYCRPNVFLDDMQIKAPFSDLSSLAPPESIKGIEVYATAGVIPAQYDLSSSTGCGSIVIWTR